MTEINITTLNINPNTIVVVQGDHEQIDFDAVQELAHNTGCTVFCLPPGATLSLLDDHAMAAAGWVRQEASCKQL